MPLRPQPGQLQERWGKIRLRDEGIHLAARIADTGRPADYSRDVVSSTEGRNTLGKEAVFPYIITVVRGIEHQRVLRLACRLQPLQDLTEEIIEIGAVGPEMTNPLTHLALRELPEAHLAHALIDAGLVPHLIVVTPWQWNIVQIIQIQIALGHHVGVMWPNEPDVKPPRPFGFRQLGEQRQCLPCDPFIMAVPTFALPVEAIGAVARAQDLPLASYTRLRLLRQLSVMVPCHTMVRPLGGTHKVLGPPPIPGRFLDTDMPFARKVQIVPGLRQILAPQAHAFLQTRAQCLTVADVVPYPMPRGVESAEECGPRGTAMGRRAIGVGERNALLG